MTKRLVGAVGTSSAACPQRGGRVFASTAPAASMRHPVTSRPSRPPSRRRKKTLAKWWGVLYQRSTAETPHGASIGGWTAGAQVLVRCLSAGISLVLPAACPTPRDCPPEVDWKGYRGITATRRWWRSTRLAFAATLSEPERGRRRWQDKKTGETPPAKRAAQRALYGNRRRIRGARGRRLQRRRGELVERPFAHQYATGTSLAGH